MLSIYEKSRLYHLPKREINKLKHQNLIKASFLIFIKSEVEIDRELIEMLDKIVKALKVEENNTEYLIFNNAVIMMEEINKYQAEKVLVFGAQSADLNLNMDLKPFKVYEFNGIKVLLVSNIIDIYGNQNLKSTLWKHLKTMF